MGKVPQLLRDEDIGVGPGAGGMRVVVRPHEVVLPEVLQQIGATASLMKVQKTCRLKYSLGGMSRVLRRLIV